MNLEDPMKLLKELNDLLAVLVVQVDIPRRSWGHGVKYSAERKRMK